MCQIVFWSSFDKTVPLIKMSIHYFDHYVETDVSRVSQTVTYPTLTIEILATHDEYVQNQ